MKDTNTNVYIYIHNYPLLLLHLLPNALTYTNVIYIHMTFSTTPRIVAQAGWYCIEAHVCICTHTVTYICFHAYITSNTTLCCPACMLSYDRYTCAHTHTHTPTHTHTHTRTHTHIDSSTRNQHLDAQYLPCTPGPHGTQGCPSASAVSSA